MNYLEFEKPLAEIEGKAEELRAMAKTGGGMDLTKEAEALDRKAETALREAGVGSVIMLDQRFPLEFCDDCGAPLYPSPEGEVAHAEMPEDQAEQMPRHLRHPLS